MILPSFSASSLTAAPLVGIFPLFGLGELSPCTHPVYFTPSKLAEPDLKLIVSSTEIPPSYVVPAVRPLLRSNSYRSFSVPLCAAAIAAFASCVVEAAAIPSSSPNTSLALSAFPSETVSFTCSSKGSVFCTCSTITSSACADRGLIPIPDSTMAPARSNAISRFLSFLPLLPNIPIPPLSMCYKRLHL